MERAYVPDSSLSLILRNKTHINAKSLPNKQTQQALLKRSKNLQKLAVRLCSRVKPPLTLMAGDFAVVPRHFLVGCSCDQLLELRSLTDDGLLHGFALNRKNDHIQKARVISVFCNNDFWSKITGRTASQLAGVSEFAHAGCQMRWKVVHVKLREGTLWHSSCRRILHRRGASLALQLYHRCQKDTDRCMWQVTGGGTSENALFSFSLVD